jgi:hypothetical protein
VSVRTTLLTAIVMFAICMATAAVGVANLRDGGHDGAVPSRQPSPPRTGERSQLPPATGNYVARTISDAVLPDQVHATVAAINRAGANLHLRIARPGEHADITLRRVKLSDRIDGRTRTLCVQPCKPRNAQVSISAKRLTSGRLRTVVAHEILHAVGLAHDNRLPRAPTRHCSVMHPSGEEQSPACRKRLERDLLAPADRLALRQLWDPGHETP